MIIPALASLFIGAADSASIDVIHPMLAEGAPPEWSVVPTSGGPTIVAVCVWIDPNTIASTEELSAAHGANIVSRLQTIPVIVLELPLSEIDDLADRPGVLRIEPAPPPFEARAVYNDENRLVTGTDYVQQVDRLTGEGVTVFVYDAGRLRADHIDLVGRVVHADEASVDTHATHVAGTVGGSGLASDGIYRGMAPATQLITASIEGNGNTLYTNPADLEEDYATALALHREGRLISNNSIGSNVSANGLPCQALGDYETTAALVDAIVIGATDEPMIVVWSVGNERSGSRCGNRFETISPPSAAKNPIQVGALNANNDSMTEFSSWGPTDDGRLKPDLTAPGCQSNDDLGVTSAGASGRSTYDQLCGTSMASPTVAGIAALMVQAHREAHPERDDPTNAYIKTVLAHTALDLGVPGPDYRHGYGRVRADRAIDVIQTDHAAIQNIESNDIREYIVQARSSDDELRVTIAWDDPPAIPGAPFALVNDLDLQLVSPSGTTHLPWILDRRHPSYLATTGVDSVNNIEQVLIDDPAPGTWTIRVSAPTLDGDHQRFAIASSHFIAVPRFVFDGALPTTIAPDTVTPIDIGVRAEYQELFDVELRLLDAFGQLHVIIPDSVGSQLTRFSLPPIACGQPVRLQVAATGTLNGTETFPDGPIERVPFTRIGVPHIRLTDDFSTDLGWTVVTSAFNSGGAWERDVPRGDGSRGDPVTAGDATPEFYMTENRPGNSDVDGGFTTLISPLFASAGGYLSLEYWSWYSTQIGANPETDAFTVQVRAHPDDAWSLVQRIGPLGPATLGGWRRSTVGFVLPATNEAQIRFVADDIDQPTVVEAAIDGVRLEELECDLCACEADGDPRSIQFTDLLQYLADWLRGAPIAERTGDIPARILVDDLLAFLECYFDAENGRCP